MVKPSITPLEEELKHHIHGDVHFDSISRRVYSVDASIYEIEPLGIVLPKTREDLIQAVKIANKHRVPIIARGAATGIAGGCLGKGLILDTSKYLNRILEINYEQEYAICEPGVVQDVLNKALAEKGYRLGPDTSTGNRATLGGMTANNSAGARSLRFGKMVDHVEEVEVILAEGEAVRFASCSETEWKAKCSQETTEGSIYRNISKIRDRYSSAIRNAFPKIPRRVSGYNLDELTKPYPLNLAKLVVGSEGSLGVITQIKVKIVKRPAVTGLCVIHFHNLLEGMPYLSEMLAFHPLSLEMIDHRIIEMGRISPVMQSKLEWLQGNPQAVFVAEFDAPTLLEVKKRLDEFAAYISSKKIGYATTLLTAPEEMSCVWEVRKAGLELLLSKRTYSRAIAFVEDVSVSPDHLAPFMEAFVAELARLGKQAGIYGHVGSGCMHIRPYIDLRSPDELKIMAEIMDKTSDLLLQYGGAMSGEHGDGIVRSWLNRKMFGEDVYQAFQELKKAFDPENRMNPGKIVDGQDLVSNLRLDPSTQIANLPTFLDFSTEGGFALAVDLCNGNGLCRKRENVMCPSFQASGDEYDSTRARAQALRGIINGKQPPDAFTHHDIHDILDLCLECKGCKKECPSHVDMAKIKSEFLYQYQEKWGYPLRSRLFAFIGAMNHLASAFPATSNSLANSRFGKWILNKLGVSTSRPLPPLAAYRFSSWVAQQSPQDLQLPPVVLFNDTFTEFNYPEIGQAAYRVLNSLGFRVIVPEWHCCGRTMISKGFLKQARAKAETLFQLLLPYAKQGIPIVGLEPSCILTLADDFQGLLGSQSQDLPLLMSNCQVIDQFLHEKWKPGIFKLHEKQQAYVHTHCHQKALVGSATTLEVLKRISQLEVIEIKSGCCGMAGSFGYEKEHVDFSLKIGELALFPAVRQSPHQSWIIANGISCRSQIAYGTQRSARHLVEFLADLL